MIEENLRRAMMISFGDPMGLIKRLISAAYLFAALALLIAIALRALRGQARRGDAELSSVADGGGSRGKSPKA
jgi:putative tricarboxylic transport membrane protein